MTDRIKNIKVGNEFKIVEEDSNINVILYNVEIQFKVSTEELLDEIENTYGLNIDKHEVLCMLLQKIINSDGWEILKK